MSVASALAETVMERADKLAELSEEDGAITRPYGTRSLASAQDLVESWMEEAGLAVCRDTVGNLIGRYESERAGAQTFVLGSHIDSVRNAGRYDGPLGVLVGIACVDELKRRAERLPLTVEVVGFVDEEGLRYHASYLGSRVYAGIFDEAELDWRDAGGVTLAEAVRAMGGDPARLGASRRRRDDLVGYYEVHIEQGPVLEADDLAVGVVTSIAGQSRGTVTFNGEEGHAGTVPMALRKDALCASAELILAIESEALDVDGLIATVGQASVDPCVGNVIPGRTTISFDVRHRSNDVRAAAVRRLRERARTIGERRRVGVAWQTIQEHAAVPFSPRLVDLLARAVESTGRVARRLPSGAGHDAVSMGHLTDVSMLFVRCAGGVSHHPSESVDVADVTAAIEVTGAFLRLVGEEHGNDA